MPINTIKEFANVCINLDVDVVFNLLKSMDYRLLEKIKDVDIVINVEHECEFVIKYIYKDIDVLVYIYSTYVIVYGDKGAVMMYEGDGEELSVRERLFSVVMDILNRIRKE